MNIRLIGVWRNPPSCEKGEPVMARHRAPLVVRLVQGTCRFLGISHTHLYIWLGPYREAGVAGLRGLCGPLWGVAVGERFEER
jgi:hypothetical protein